MVTVMNKYHTWLALDRLMSRAQRRWFAIAGRDNEREVDAARLKYEALVDLKNAWSGYPRA
jgi:hypothetical protein